METSRNHIGYLTKHIIEFARDFGVEGLPEQLQRLTKEPRSPVRIAIMGSVKAGKSTLLNRLIGARILPSSHLQCSSEIIEIDFDINHRLTLSFADGRTTDILVDTAESLRQRLLTHAAVPDRYREIPHTLLDRIILQSQGEKVRPSAAMIEELEQTSGLTDLTRHSDLIKDYLRNRSTHDIPVKIHVGLPDFPFPNLTLLDSPGSHAVGGIGVDLHAKLGKLDGLLVVHSLQEPIETRTLKASIDAALELCRADAIALVLTKSATVSPLEMEQKLREAKRLYAGKIYSERFFPTDSLLATLAIDHGQDIDYKQQILSRKQREGAERDHILHELQKLQRLWREHRETLESENDGHSLHEQSGLPSLENYLSEYVHDRFQRPFWRQLRKMHSQDHHVEITCPPAIPLASMQWLSTDALPRETLMSLYQRWLQSVQDACVEVFEAQRTFYITRLKKLSAIIAQEQKKECDEVYFFHSALYQSLLEKTHNPLNQAILSMSYSTPVSIIRNLATAIDELHHAYGSLKPRLNTIHHKFNSVAAKYDNRNKATTRRQQRQPIFGLLQLAIQETHQQLDNTGIPPQENETIKFLEGAINTSNPPHSKRLKKLGNHQSLPASKKRKRKKKQHKRRAY